MVDRLSPRLDYFIRSQQRHGTPMLSSLKRFLLLISCLACFANASAQVELLGSGDMAAPQSLTVGVYVHPPFVIKGEDDFTGMAIDLWKEMAARLNLNSAYVEFNNVGE